MKEKEGKTDLALCTMLSFVQDNQTVAVPPLQQRSKIDLECDRGDSCQSLHPDSSDTH